MGKIKCPSDILYEKEWRASYGNYCNAIFLSNLMHDGESMRKLFHSNGDTHSITPLVGIFYDYYKDRDKERMLDRVEEATTYSDPYGQPFSVDEHDGKRVLWDWSCKMSDELIELIKVDIERAAYVDRLLPSVRAPKYRCCMPDIIYTEQEKIFMDKKMIKIRPNKEQLDLWEKVMFLWMPLLDVDERRLVWKRANHIPWKLLCKELGVSRQILAIRYDKAILKICYGCLKCH